MATSRKYVGRDCSLDLLADGVEEYFQTRNAKEAMPESQEHNSRFLSVNIAERSTYR